MLKILWLTDTHVDKMSAENDQELLDFILASKADGMWLTGDIGDPPHNIEFLKALFERFKKPVFFVLGNHDFYTYKIADLRFKMTQLVKSYPLANYLSETPGLDNDGHLIVGMDCFANTGQDIIQQMTWDSDHILDLAAGSGDLAILFKKKNPKASVIHSDINQSMLEEGQKKIIDQGLIISSMLINAEQIPFPDNSFDLVSIGFGLRNMTNKQSVLNEVFRSNFRTHFLRFS